MFCEYFFVELIVFVWSNDAFVDEGGDKNENEGSDNLGECIILKHGMIQ